MTSIDPRSYVINLAQGAQRSLDAATAALVGGDIRPMDGPRIGIPEQNGPDTPDNPWFMQRPEPVGSFTRAARIAGEAVRQIDEALSLSGSASLSHDVLVAFGQAKNEAVAGVRQLTAQTTRPIDPMGVKMQFDGAKVWLDTAQQLMLLQTPDRPRPGVPPVVTIPRPGMPPVTTMPVPPVDPSLPGLVGPGDPGSPITILPIDPPAEPIKPIKIKLPNPDSPIQ